jgi:tRNA(Ile)-lysidine synthase
VALLRALYAVGSSTGQGAGKVVAAHVHHGLRDDDADCDQALVAELCRQLDLPLEVRRVNGAELAAAEGDGVEAAARKLRYECFEEMAEACGARYVATAHTADDQAETILHRIMRGTGIAGLAGMPRVRRLTPALTLIRPLLDVRRSDVIDYLDSIRQPYREDRTNRDTRFTRNRIRHELLPKLAAEYHGKVTEALLRLGQLAGEAQAVIDRQVDELARVAVDCSEADTVWFARTLLVDQPRFLVREVIMTAWRVQEWPRQAMGYAQWDRLADLLIAGVASPAETLPGGIVARHDGERLTLSRT